MRSRLTAERLRELFDYDPLTGIFTYRVATLRKAVGSVAGSPHPGGYIQFTVDGRSYLAHRLAWLYVHGVWPDPECDHEDTVRTHNWIANLRQATKSQNMQNQRRPHKGNTSGFLGVCWNAAKGKWSAQIKVGKRNSTIGDFDQPEQASAAYIERKRQVHERGTL